jgi:hypothetical protein
VPVVDRLRKRFSIGRICIVADRGMISAETIAELEARGLRYILGVRERSDKLVRDLVLADPAPFIPLTIAKRGKEIDYEAKAVMLAVGARAKAIPQIGLEADGDRIWAYREAMAPKAMPGSIIVIGSGAIGIEFGSFYRALGAEVTVVEALDRIMPVEDEEVSRAAQKSFDAGRDVARVPFDRVVEVASSVGVTRPKAGFPQVNYFDVGLPPLSAFLTSGMGGGANIGLYFDGRLSNPLCFWVVRLQDRTMVTVLYPGNPVARESIETYIGVVKSVFQQALEEKIALAA